LSDPNKTTYTDLEKAEILMAIQQLQSRVKTNPANTLEVSNSELINLKLLTEEAKKDLKIAEERVATLRNPEKDRSYYESWFPINRPLTNNTIIIILGIGIFFFVLSFLIVLKTFGVHLQISVTWFDPGIFRRLFNYLLTYINKNPTIALLSLLVVIFFSVTVVLGVLLAKN
jgi:hypothetical protein